MPRDNTLVDVIVVDERDRLPFGRPWLTLAIVHVVFTLPHAVLPLTYRNSTRLYRWLFQTSAATLQEAAGDPRHLPRHCDKPSCPSVPNVRERASRGVYNQVERTREIRAWHCGTWTGH